MLYLFIVFISIIDWTSVYIKYNHCDYVQLFDLFLFSIKLMKIIQRVKKSFFKLFILIFIFSGYLFMK